MNAHPTKATYVKVVSYAKRVEAARFWRLSKSIRLGLHEPAVVDQEIDLYLTKGINQSPWLIERLKELKELNRKRF